MRLLIVLIVALANYALCSAEDDDNDTIDYRNYKVIRAIPETLDHLEALRGLDLEHSIKWKLDFWNPPSQTKSSVHIGAPFSTFERLQDSLSAAGVPFSTLIHDYQLLIDQELQDNPRQFSPFSRSSDFAFDQYHRFEEIAGYIKQLEKDYPDLVKVQFLEETYEKREINGVQIGLNSSSHKPVIYIDAGVHAGEWIGPATALYIINELVSKVETDDEIKNLLTKYDFFMIPVLNPDGYTYTWNGRRSWRKNLSVPEPVSGCKGVDANRNYPLGFAGASTSQNPCSNNYCGPEPFSEAESRAVMKYTVLNSERMKVAVSLHSFGQLWMTPWGYKEDKPADYDVMIKGARTAVDALHAVNGTNYKVGSIYDIIYPAGGSSVDWQYSLTKEPHSYALELPDTGKYGMLLPKEYIIPAAHEFWTGLKALVNSL